jgi:uncharacterized membrane protein
MAKTILGIFNESDNAEYAINELKDEGYNPKDMSIVMKDRREGERLADDTGADVAGGAVSGAASGAVLGGLAGLLASFVIPGLGAFFIGGPIAAALGLTGAAASAASGAATGALAGGLLGALTGLGLTEDEARTYEESINEGGILVAVPARNNEESVVESILSEYGASNIKTINNGEASRERGRGMHDDADEHTHMRHGHNVHGR